MQTESQDNTWIDDKLKVRDGKLRRPNNNHHVVPLGILVVLSTIYLMIAGLQINYNYYFNAGVDAVEISNQNLDSPEAKVFALEESNRADPPCCQQVEIFAIQEHISHRSTKRQKQKIAKNGNALATGSRSSKTVTANKKKEVAKKSNTAEPIIYLFALVFIYLLLKAASDINQHYKSNKGDKRLRRCSLQSYAQKDQRSAHLDRRASKVAPLQSRQHLFSEVRSVSLDRCKHDNGPAAHKMRKQISIGDQSRTYPVPAKHPTEMPRGRRLSVPISINYQTINVSPIVHPELARRGSVISLGSLADINSMPGAIATATPDAKRRVRMINRH